MRHFSATLRTNLWQYSPIASGDSDGLDHLPPRLVTLVVDGGGTCGEPTYVQQFNHVQLQATPVRFCWQIPTNWLGLRRTRVNESNGSVFICFLGYSPIDSYRSSQFLPFEGARSIFCFFGSVISMLPGSLFRNPVAAPAPEAPEAPEAHVLYDYFTQRFAQAKGNQGEPWIQRNQVFIPLLSLHDIHWSPNMCHGQYPGYYPHSSSFSLWKYWCKTSSWIYRLYREILCLSL